jgi:hypothetical protein
MTKKKRYRGVRFTTEAIRQATALFDQKVKRSLPTEKSFYLTIEIGEEEWKHDSLDEFFADYGREPTEVHYIRRNGNAELGLLLLNGRSIVSVTADSRSKVEAVFAVFETHLGTAHKLAAPDAADPIVFIGHGRSVLWRDLKDHLHEKHGYRVEAYEIGARAGHAIRDILNDMLARASFAVLVMTGDDCGTDGKLVARQNVIHEVGLFQGELGFARAIVLLEEGVEEFSNIHGIEQIRFRQSNIKETFGDVLATLRREFE